MEQRTWRFDERYLPSQRPPPASCTRAPRPHQRFAAASRWLLPGARCRAPAYRRPEIRRPAPTAPAPASCTRAPRPHQRVAAACRWLLPGARVAEAARRGSWAVVPPPCPVGPSPGVWEFGAEAELRDPNPWNCGERRHRDCGEFFYFLIFLK